MNNSSSSTNVIIFLSSVLIALTLAGIAVVSFLVFRSDPVAVNSTAAVSNATPNAQPQAAPALSAPDARKEAPAQNNVAVVTVTQFASPQPVGQPVYTDNYGSKKYTRYNVGNNHTSNAFAENVTRAYYNNYVQTGNQDAVLRVYSPVTNQSYDMYCNSNGHMATCRGGKNAVVHVY